jgi:hypothetical protein
MGFLTRPYRVTYQSRSFQVGLSDIVSTVLKPNGNVVGVFRLVEFPSPMKGRYYFDFLTSANDTEGEYFAAIFSPSEGIQDTLRISLYLALDTNILSAKVDSLSDAIKKIESLVELIAVSTV